MDRVFERAAQWGVETQHYDGLGRHWTVEPAVLARILDAIGAQRRLVQARARRAIVNRQRAYQGDDSLAQRSWAIAVQLYGIRSRRNWGHGDFTDLANLIDIAGALGAAAIGLNPLHALFDDRPDEASPYFPNSRHFLNPLYIDVEAIPEFPQAARGDFQNEIEALREKRARRLCNCREHQGSGAGAGLRLFLFARQRRAPAAVRCVPAPARIAACGLRRIRIAASALQTSLVGMAR